MALKLPATTCLCTMRPFLVMNFRFKKDTADQNNKTFVIKFDGDIQAKAVDSLKKEVSAVLSIANNKDNVVLILESPGGTVSGFGLAASELERLTAKGLKLTVLIDSIYFQLQPLLSHPCYQ